MRAANRARTSSRPRRVRTLLTWTVLGWIGVTAVPVIALRWVPPITTAFMLRDQIADLAQGRSAPVRYRWVAWDKIHPALRLAVVAAEDQKFPDHWGFDLESISRAVDRNETARQPRGASTITQQTAKNLFLWRGRSYLRKGLEAYLTVLLELAWPKRRILEMYLNIAQFGKGVYGVGAASDAFFGKPPSRLSTVEAALLAAVLPNPERLSARAPSPFVLERARWIEAQMEHLGGPAYLRRL